MTKLLASVLLAASLPTTACLVGNGDSGSESSHILGGTADAGDPSVVALLYTGFDTNQYGCTGSLIAPTLILTAGHCANGFAYQYNASPDASPSGGGWTTAGVATANPAYTGDPTQGNDVAVISLFSAAATAPLALGAAPAVGDDVRAVGYGFTTAVSSGGSFGTKETKSFAVDGVTTHEFTAGPDETCHGDSGGPVFDASGAIVGTTSYGDTDDCNGDDHFMRMDDNAAWLDQMIANAAGTTAGGGGSGGVTDQCDSTNDDDGVSEEVKCSNGQCQCLVNGALDNTCADTGGGCSIPGSCCGF